MGKSSLLQTDTKNFYQLMGNGLKYVVPPYQRDYSWKENHWEDIWEDIIFAIENDQEHYMGTIVLQSNNRENLIVIDGQQRLVTLTIFALSIIRCLQELIDQDKEAKENKERKDTLMSEYIGTKDAASLKYSTKISLNNNNNNFYQSHIANYKKPKNLRVLNDSNKLIWKCQEYFINKIKKHLGKDPTGYELAVFLGNASKALKFIIITVEDELSAYTVFETLNARGEDLTATDLLKNYLFSRVSSETDMRQMEHQWQLIAEGATIKDFPNFLRYFLNFQQGTIRKDRLFKTLKTQINSAEDAFSLVDKLEKHVGVYSALKNPADEFWNSLQANWIDVFKLFNIKQTRSLCMVAYDKLDENSFTKLLEILVIISFRYNIISGMNPNEQERVYNQIAVKLYKNEINSIAEIKQGLKEIYIDNGQFEANFASKSFNTTSKKRLVKYILAKLEKDAAKIDIDPDSSNYTIEHILPKNPGNEWNYLSPADQQTGLYQLGNMVLLESKINQDIQNSRFAEKKERYKDSKLTLPKEIDAEKWDLQAIKKRQQKMAKRASHVWRINF